jgi:SAM-dependent methyltransferase
MPASITGCSIWSTSVSRVRTGATIRAVPDGLYGDPDLYAWAFSHRDVTGEVDALLRWYARHGPRRSPRRAIELGSGPAEHAVELARRGVRVTALDASAPMRMAARRAARSSGVELEVVGGQMTSFSLTKRFDLALSVGDTVAHLHAIDDLVAHLDAVGRHLTPGGVLVIEATHPADFIGGRARTRSSWQVTRNGQRLRVRWNQRRPGLDPVTQLEHASVTLTTDAGVVRHDLVLRRWTATEIEAAARLSKRLRISATYGDYDDTPLADPGASRLVVVLTAAGPTKTRGR